MRMASAIAASSTLPQLFVVDRARRVVLAGLQQARRAQQGSDVVSSKRPPTLTCGQELARDGTLVCVEFTYDALPGRVVFGAGARARVAHEVGRLGDRIFLVHGESARPVAAELRARIGDAVVGSFGDVRQHVPRSLADHATDRARRADANVLLSVGGGSSIGFAKAIALQHDAPILALPTTYAGSEMTPIWGLTEGGTKTTGRALRVLPSIVVYDPEVTVTLSPRLTASSGLNALAHGVEALYAPAANPITSVLAEESIRVLAAGLPAAVADGADLEARSRCLYGACLAARALAVAGTSVHHTLCHVLGGRHGLPHAPTHAVLLPYVVAVIAAHVDPAAMVRLGRALGTGDPVGGLFALQRAVAAPTRLADIGMVREDLDATADAAVPSAIDLLPGVTDDAVHRILRDAFDGRRDAAGVRSDSASRRRGAR